MTFTQPGRALLVLALIILFPFMLLAQSNVVELQQDEDGWRMFVDGSPFEVKGIVWAFTPIGENYSYNLWNQEEDFIKRMIDTDAQLLKAMGANAIRTFADIPPEWVEYLYYQHGIYSIINPMFGRYGMSVRGIWYPNTDYSDRYTREAILEEALEYVERFKDTAGVLMFLFGNENNYGLEWDSDTIENLPVGQRLESRAGYLYSLFEEAISEARRIDPHHPMGLVNGDIQYLNIIRELVPSLQVLGVNTYRGGEAQDLFYQSIQSLNVPFVFTELGADAFNARTNQEDQYHQAMYLKRQWQEIYEQSWGKGGYGNVLGAFVFEWIDEWWKHGMEEGLDEHEPEGSWRNGGYSHDAAPGLNNMNEEWFGIVSQGPFKFQGIYERHPRAAYYLLADAWTLPLYDSSLAEVRSHFAGLELAGYTALGESNSLRNELKTRPVSLSMFQLDASARLLIDDSDIGADFKQGVEIESRQEARIGLEFNPTANLSASLELRTWLNPPVSGFRTPFSYYEIDEVSGESQENFLLYSSSLEYAAENFELHGYYHTGHGDWYLEGDFFYLLPESWDQYSMDVSGSVAPFGLEFIGKNALEGLTIYGGPEVYWGARPQIIAKYFTGGSLGDADWSLGLIHQEEIATGNEEIASYGPGRKSSVFGQIGIGPWFDLKVGGLFAGMEKLGASYSVLEAAEPGAGIGGSDYNVDSDNEIGIMDTLAGKAELSTSMFRYSTIYLRYLYAGLVTDTPAMIPRSGFINADSGSGNRQEINLGAQVIMGNLSIWPELRYRAPLVEPMLPVGTADYRSILTDPFAVYHNRESIEGELVLTYDPTGATYFHNWNADDIEDADIAASASLLYILYAGPTDANVFKDASGTWFAFDSGLPAQENLFAGRLKVISNPLPGLRLLGAAEIGHLGSQGVDTRLVNYIGADLGIRYRQLLLQGGIDLSAWGPEIWYRQFNLNYPTQWNLDLSYEFDASPGFFSGSRVGMNWTGRSFGEYSASDEPDEGFLSELTFYTNVSY